jgi:hypothetical protein
MSYAQPSHRIRLAAAVGSGFLAATFVTALLPTAAHADALPGTLAVTTPSNGKLAADTAKQVVVLTVSGTGATVLTEDNVTGIKLSADTDCDDLTNYVVTSATTVTVKTPTDGCAASAAGDVAILLGSDTITKVNGLAFIAPPAILAVGSKPVINDNSALLSTSDQQRRFSTTGGQTVRIKAGANFAFSPKSASALSVTIGGKLATDLKVYDSINGTVPLATTADGVNANSLTVKTTTGMVGDTVTISQDGVSKSFASAAHLATVVAVPTVTSLSVNSGRAKGTVSTVITGTNLPKLLADAIDTDKWLVEFCGVAGTVTAASSAGTALTVTVPDLSVASGLGTTTYAGTCRVKVTDVAAVGGAVSSPISSGAYFIALNE